MIYTDKKQIQTDLLYADITYKVRSAIFKVYNELGYGHKEGIYQKALEIEFEKTKLPFIREKTLSVIYQGIAVGTYRPDFIIDDKVIIELKAVDFMPKTFETQLLHYLKTTGYNLGLLVNFGTTILQIKRLVWSKNPRESVL